MDWDLRPVTAFRSAEQIEAGLKQDHPDDQETQDHPDDEEMRISHETIYRSLYVQSRGELRWQLSKKLRTGRRTRRARERVETRGHISEMAPIAQRPPEVDDRRVPGTGRTICSPEPGAARRS